MSQRHVKTAGFPPGMFARGGGSLRGGGEGWSASPPQGENIQSFKFWYLKCPPPHPGRNPVPVVIFFKLVNKFGKPKFYDQNINC